MRIILVPSDTGKRRSISLSRRQVRLLTISVVGVLPVLAGVAGFYLSDRSAFETATTQPDYGNLIEKELQTQRSKIAQARTEVADHLDALGRNLGRLHAQVSRINALGQRLTEMAGLDPSEFDFDEEPALGGPEPQSGVQDRAETQFMQSFDRLERRLQEKYEELRVLQSLLMDRTLHGRQFPRGWPIDDGWLSSGYGYRTDPFTGRREFHGGVDIAGNAGGPIKAVAEGVVTHAGVKPAYGLMVEINHGNGYTTRYAHALAAVVQAGDRVEKGQIIAVVGNSGRSTGPHLHFEVLLNDRTVNPRRYLKASG